MFEAMKNIVFTLAAIATLFTSCVKSEGEQIFVEKNATITVEVAPESRTYTDGTNIYWAETGEQLNIIYFADESTSRRQSATHTDYTLVDNRAQFTADFTTTDGATKYTFGAFYPYAYKSTTSSISLYTLNEQTPTENSYDPKGDILVSKEPTVVYGTPDKVQFTFARLVAFAKMTLKGINAGEKIEKIVFSSPMKPAGAVTVKVHEAGTLDNAKWYNNYEDITLNMGNRVATGEDTVWFTTVPTDLSGSSFKVTVVTDKNNYVKEVDLTGKTLNFERANVAQFTVKDLAIQEKPKAYKLLTDIAELNAGDQIIICTKKTATSSAKALSTTASGTKLAQTSSFTVENGPQIVTLPEGVALFTVENGTEAGTFAFKCDSGYLYGNYDSANWTNTLSFKTAMDAETLWNVSLDDSYKASICNPLYTRYVNYYSSTFNFANSASSTYIYYVDGEAQGEPEQPVVTPLATPVVSATASANSVTVAWDAVAGAKDYTVTCGTATQTVTASPATFTDLEFATEYTVSVVANPADATLNTASEAGVATVTTEAAQGGAEAQTITIQCPVDGAKSGNSVGTLHSGDVIISSTGSWRTDNADGRDAIYIGRNTSGELRIEAQNGKTITKVILTAPVGYLIDLKAKEHDRYTTTTFASTSTATWSGECKSRIVYTAAGSSHSNIESITVEYK